MNNAHTYVPKDTIYSPPSEYEPGRCNSFSSIVDSYTPRDMAGEKDHSCVQQIHPGPGERCSRVLQELTDEQNH